MQPGSRWTNYLAESAAETCKQTRPKTHSEAKTRPNFGPIHRDGESQGGTKMR